MICKICHKDFIPLHNAQKFCSDECRGKARQIEYRALIESGKSFDELKARANSRQAQCHSHLRAGRKYS